MSVKIYEILYRTWSEFAQQVEKEVLWAVRCVCARLPDSNTGERHNAVVVCNGAAAQRVYAVRFDTPLKNWFVGGGKID